MIVLGINSGQTKSGRALNDGGACLVKDGEIVAAIQEERVSRKKYDSGFAQAIDYVCETAGISYGDIDYIVVSSCIDNIWTVEEADRLLGLNEKYGFSRDKILVLDHHLSHGYCGFISSGYEEALVCVLDNMGNKLSHETPDLWSGSFERSSYYWGYWKDGRPILELIERDADGPNEAGYGEAFRYFTHYFGWDSYKHAGKTMGLSAYGNPESFGDLSLFKSLDGREICMLGASHVDPEKELRDFFGGAGIKLPKKLNKGENVTQYYADMAYFLQREFETSLARKVRSLLKKHNLSKVVVSGGVALNCVANGLLLKLREVRGVYVPSAPGDEGQSMGNALYGYYSKTKSIFGPAMIKSCFFGKKYSDLSWKEYARQRGLIINKKEAIEKETALLLTKGNIIGWFQSKSEFGPRALGHRSILADPRFDFMKEKINTKIKFREEFRPFAPSFLEEDQQEFFDCPNIQSYFMSFALPIKSSKQRYIPAITHIDGTARLQTVSKGIDERYYKLISEFKELTGVPCILNTSFNLNDEPIVETPINAINTFLRCDMDYLVIGDYLIRKKTFRKKI